jgi:hypothetical protein
MNDAINPEAATPSVRLSFEQSDRNPMVTNWDGNGGPFAVPASIESRITPAGTPPSTDSGMTDYNTQDSSDQVENENEREG